MNALYNTEQGQVEEIYEPFKNYVARLWDFLSSICQLT